MHRVPVHIAEDYVLHDASLLALLVAQLHRAGSIAEAAALYKRHANELSGTLEPDVDMEMQAMLLTAPAIPDVFGPHNPTALSLPLASSDVVWVASHKEVASVEATVRAASVVAVDLEWGAKGEWVEPSLALMQLAVGDRVFLIDLAADGLQAADGPMAALLQTLLGRPRPLLLGFAFHNDIRELSRSPWAASVPQLRGSGSEPVRGLCDLQALTGRPREGLSKLAERTLGAPLCKAEQRSYWHRRPLRQAQLHYGALDAHVLLQVAAALVEEERPADAPVTAMARFASLLREDQESLLQALEVFMTNRGISL